MDEMLRISAVPSDPDRSPHRRHSAHWIALLLAVAVPAPSAGVNLSLRLITFR